MEMSHDAPEEHAAPARKSPPKGKSKSKKAATKSATKAARVKVLERTEKALTKVKAVEAAPVLSETQQIMAQIAALARDPTIDGAKLAQLWGMLKEMKAEKAREAFYASMHALQPKLPRIKKDGIIYTNEVDPKTNRPILDEITGKKVQVEQSRYPTWEAIDGVMRPLLHSHGFSLTFDVQQEPGSVTVVAVLTHTDGHQTRTPAPALPVDPTVAKHNPVKGWGSAASYGKRYSAILALNIVAVDEDDDGGAAGASVPGKITAEQVTQIESMIGDAQTNKRAVCALGGVEDLAQLSPGKAKEIRDRLQAKIDRLRTGAPE